MQGLSSGWTMLAGTMTWPLAWSTRISPRGGRVEVWCSVDEQLTHSAASNPPMRYRIRCSFLRIREGRPPLGIRGVIRLPGEPVRSLRCGSSRRGARLHESLRGEPAVAPGIDDADRRSLVLDVEGVEITIPVLEDREVLPLERAPIRDWMTLLLTDETDRSHSELVEVRQLGLQPRDELARPLALGMGDDEEEVAQGRDPRDRLAFRIGVDDDPVLREATEVDLFAVQPVDRPVLDLGGRARSSRRRRTARQQQGESQQQSSHLVSSRRRLGSLAIGGGARRRYGGATDPGRTTEGRSRGARWRGIRSDRSRRHARPVPSGEARGMRGNRGSRERGWRGSSPGGGHGESIIRAGGLRSNRRLRIGAVPSPPASAGRATPPSLRLEKGERKYLEPWVWNRGSSRDGTVTAPEPAGSQR